MQSKSTKTIEVTLIMDEIEAKWLMGMMQNPLCGLSEVTEDPEDKTMRKVFWDALRREGMVV